MPQFTGSILKADAFGRVERLQFGDQVVLRRVACGGAWPLSGWLARRLLARERKALARLQGIPGFPLLVDAPWADAHPGPTGSVPLAREVLVREFVDGEALHRATSLASNFFERLEELVDRMHAEGVCHNDLHKEQNILVDPRGFPCLIDFQLASVHSGPSRAFRVRVHEDRRHVQKHRRRYLRDGRGPVGSAPPAARLPRKPLSWVWRRTGKPIYHWFTRSVLGRWDGEERRPSTGPWPRWTGPLPPW